MGRTAIVLLLLLVVASSAAQASTWQSPKPGQALSAHEVVQVVAPLWMQPVLTVDEPPSEKAQGELLRPHECGPQTCRYETFLDTTVLTDGPHTLYIGGVPDAPEPIAVTVDNSVPTHRIHAWKDPYNPWPQTWEAGSQRRLLWLANLGSEPAEVQVSVRARPAWDDLRLTEVHSNLRHDADAPATWTLQPTQALQLQVSGNATAPGRLDVVVSSGDDRLTLGSGSAAADGKGTPGLPAPAIGAGLALLAWATRRRPA